MDLTNNLRQSLQLPNNALRAAGRHKYKRTSWHAKKKTTVAATLANIGNYNYTISHIANAAVPKRLFFLLCTFTRNQFIIITMLWIVRQFLNICMSILNRLWPIVPLAGNTASLIYIQIINFRPWEASNKQYFFISKYLWERSAIESARYRDWYRSM